MILDDLLSSDAFTPVNKALAKKLWFVCAWYLWELIRQRKRFWESEFYFSQSQMEKEIGINWYTQRQCVKQLTNLWIISVERKWTLNKYYFLINDDKIIEFFKEDIQCFKNWTTSGLNFKSPVVKDLKDIDKKENKKESKKLLYCKDSKAEILEEIPLLSVNIEEEKEKSSAKKEKEVIYNEYDFVEEFIDKNNWTIQYLLNKDKDYIKKQSKYVDKLIKQWYDIETIKTVLNFIKQDDFWRKNILSVEKLLRKNKDWVPYIVVMIEKIKQYRPKAIDLDSLYINN